MPEGVFVNRFLSNAINRIDSKGRVSVPGHFRTVLQTGAITELYTLQSLDMPAVDAGGLDLLERYETRIGDADPLMQTSDDLSFFCHGDGSFLKLDSTGRITVTDFVREHTGITDEVAFVGRGSFFQMWDPQAFLAHRAAVRERLRAMKAGPS